MKALLSVLLLVAVAYASMPAATEVWLDQDFSATWIQPIDSYDLYSSTNTLVGGFYDTQVFKVWVNSSVPGFDVVLVGITASSPTSLSASYDYLYVYGRPNAAPCGYPEYEVEQDSYYPCDYSDWDYNSFYVDTSSTDYTLWTYSNYHDSRDWSVGGWYYIRVDGTVSSSYPYVGTITLNFRLTSSAASCPGTQVPYGYDYSYSNSYIECGPAATWVDPTTANAWAWNVTNQGDILWAVNTTNRMIGSLTASVNITNAMGVDSSFVLRARGNAIPNYYIYCDYNYFSVDTTNAWAYATITCVNVLPGTFYFEITSYDSDTVSYKTAFNGTVNLWVNWNQCTAGWAGLNCDEPVYELGLDTDLNLNRTIQWYNTNNRYMSHHYWVNVSNTEILNLEFDPLTFFFAEYSGSIYVYARNGAPACDANSAGCSISESFDADYNVVNTVDSYYVHLYEADFAANGMWFITVTCETSSYNCTYGPSRVVPAPLPSTTTTGSSSSSTAVGTTTTGSSSSSTAVGTTTTGTASTAVGTTTTGGSSSGTTSSGSGTTSSGAGTTTSRATTTTTTSRGTTTGAGTTSGKAGTTGSASSVAVSALLVLVAALALLL